MCEVKKYQKRTICGARIVRVYWPQVEVWSGFGAIMREINNFEEYDFFLYWKTEM